ncbi:MAG: AAA family ATPase [Chloroflexi bacterium]|nr:AAA family ATPase [Chloroflexota bacterium]
MDTTAYPTTVYVLGTERNIGKTVTSIGIISTLLAPEHGYCIDDIGYIKPVGQQTVKVPGRDGATLDIDKDAVLLTTLLGVHCDDYAALSPVVWRGGTTATLIEQAAGGDAAQPREQMLERIRAGYRTVAAGRRIVIAEGTGQPGVGSVSGISNADVIGALRAMGVPVFVVLVAPGGIGSTIDQIFPYLMTLDHVGCRLDGLIINGVYPLKMDKIRGYLETYYGRVFPQLYGRYLTRQGAPPILGFVPTVDELRLPSMRFVAEALAEESDTKVEIVVPDSLEHACDPIRNLKVISLDFGYEPYLRPGDAVVVGVNANETISNTVRLHQRLLRERGAGLAGLILSCATVGGLAQQTYELLRAEGLPTILLQQDSAEIVQRIEGITVKIQPYDTAKRELIARAYREHLTLWPELRDAPRPGVLYPQ